MMHMKRVQVQLTDEQVAWLEARSQDTRRSHAAVVRDLLDEAMSQDGRAELLARARAAIGGFRSGLSDVSERHDDYLAEAIAEDLGVR